MQAVSISFDYREIRAILAKNRISHKKFAEACGLNSCYVSRILTGSAPWESAYVKIMRGLKELGLESEVKNEA